MNTKISDSEFIVMKALWQRHPLSAEDVIMVTAKDNSWEGNTVRTLLNRLLKKQAISAERINRKYFYTPIVTRKDVERVESKTFLNKLFDGKLAPLVSHLSQDNRLSLDDIADLKRLIKDIEDDV